MMLYFIFKELHTIKTCPKNGKPCMGQCGDNEEHEECYIKDFVDYSNLPLHLNLKDAEWYKVSKLQEIFEIFDKIKDTPYRIVAGNTGQGK